MATNHPATKSAARPPRSDEQTEKPKRTRGFNFNQTKPIPPRPETGDDADDIRDMQTDSPDEAEDDRLTRDQESRYAEDLSDEDDYDDAWEEPELLTAPDPRPGFAQRWMRTTVDGKPDPANVAKRFNQGWRPRRADTIPPGIHAPTIRHGEFAGVIGIEGMVLVERPMKRQLAQRRRVMQDAADQIRGVENDLHRVHDPASGLGKPSLRVTTKVTRGRPVEIADDD